MMVFSDCDDPGNENMVFDSGGNVDVTAAERARQREIASYLTAASIDLQEPRCDPSLGLPPKCSKDPNLTALVQLGALRLDCDRSFLSLIDGTTQYIIAESTRTTPLNKLKATPEETGLYLGVVKLDASWGVCPNTMKVFTDENGVLAMETPNVTADTTRYIIRDFHADDHFKQKPYVLEWPYMRSYAEVPIISPLGYIIGGYCVVDTRLRDFGDETVKVLTEVASTLMAHLENVRVMHNRMRSEKLIRGLDTFIQEETAIRESRSILSSQSSRNGSISHSSNHGSSSTRVTKSLSKAPPSETGSSETTSSSNTSSNQGSQRNDENSNPGGSTKTKTNQSDSSEPKSKPEPEPEPEPSKSSVESPIESNDVTKAFERSASLIREAMGMDGLVFFDACPIGFTSRQPMSNAFDADPFTSNYDDLFDFSPSKKPSPILAMSHSKNEKEDLKIPEGLLYRMIRRFKQGHVFTADEHGPFEKRSKPLEQNQNKFPSSLKRQDSTGPNDTVELFEYLPKARSIIFLPLWHFQKEKWFAAALGWTFDSTKSFDPSDATYLNAFGNAIMAEILRLETLAVSRAKSDFISSISHELRSPLHGILATSELLGELLKSQEEKNLLNMLRSCGVTLLDTMNHLLDYAKINSLALTRDSKRKRSIQKSKNTIFNVETYNLSQLVEDVVESVFVGYGFENGSRNLMKSDITSSMQNLGVTDIEPELPVLVTMDITANWNWNLKINTGAWRRIVMNLFGNSLKYTPSGTIEVKLDVIQQTTGQQILFQVKDTGIGMDTDYQKYKLFQPFAQENSLSAGTGLGLCIVQQIVQNLGGTIDVQSERGVGSIISVRIPIEEKIKLSMNMESNSDELFSRLQGLELGYIKSEILEKNEDELIGSAGALYEYHKVLEKSLTSIASTWLKMNLKIGSKLEDIKADVYFLDDSISLRDVDISTLFPPPVIISRSTSLKTGNSLSIKLPIGPRKLANALINALDSSTLQMNQEKILQTNLHDNVKTNVFGQNGFGQNGLPSPPEESPGDNLESKQSNFSSTTLNLTTLNSTTLNSTTLNPTTTFNSITPNHHVLLVDDNPINLKILITLIKRIGCTYLAACNGLEAVQFFKASSGTKPFSFVFMDISMPVMDGFTATREIRAYESEIGISEGVNIIALTGLGSEESEKEAFSSGMDLFLTKPVSLVKLKKLLVPDVDII